MIVKFAFLTLIDRKFRGLNCASQRNSPDIIFMPSANDIHQGHYSISQKGIRAFKFYTIFCYEMLWNKLTFNTSSFLY